MKKTLIEAPEAKIRSTDINLISIVKMNRALLFAVSIIFVLAMGLFGFSFGHLSADTISNFEVGISNDMTVPAYVSVRDLICLEIESIDQQSQNKILQQENDTIKSETETIEDKILGSLMSNLETKKLASRSATLDSYIKEAKNLLDLNWKLIKFKKTEDYNLIDISEYEKALTARLSHIPTLKPVPGSFGGYGWRIHPIYKYKQFHAASDQGAPHGTPVKAAASGYVITSSYDRSSGNYIVINHGNGFVTKYLHHSKNIAKAGKWVEQGEVIGKVGTTGTSTCPHLHFEVIFNGSPLDPRKILIQ